jgi:hypothetical protein
LVCVFTALASAYAADSPEPPTLDDAAASNAVMDDELNGQSGGYASTTTVTQTGTVTGNTLTNSTTGSNEIGAGSFLGLSGVATVIQNTGNQVLIQTSTVVNVSVK